MTEEHLPPRALGAHVEASSGALCGPWVKEAVEPDVAGAPSHVIWDEHHDGRRLGYPDSFAFAATLAAVVTELIDLRMPVDLEQWCEASSVVLEWVHTPEEGHYSRSASGSTVRVRPGGSDVRRNFTVAHELGHHFLEESRANPSVRRALPDPIIRMLSHIEVGGTDEERICNLFATCLLLPDSAVTAAVDGQEITLRLVRKLADHFRVSPSATVIRLNQLRLTNATYVRCHQRLDSYEVLFWAGGREPLKMPAFIHIPYKASGDGPVEALLWSGRRRAVQLDLDQRADGFCAALIKPRDQADRH